MTTRRQFHLHALGLGVAASACLRLRWRRAAPTPNRPIKIIVPYAAGGVPTCSRARWRSNWPRRWERRRVVVDNIVGAGGILAAQSVARMAPDGYNILMGASSHIVQKAMEPGAKFDPLKDFTPITRAFAPVHRYSWSAPLALEDGGRAHRGGAEEPGKLNYASGGVGSAAHMSAAAMALQAQVDVVHVPYKGSVEIVPSILTGATQFAFPIASTAIPQIQGGRVRALAVSSAQRMVILPDVPSLVEAFKAPDLALEAWFGLWAPAGTHRTWWTSCSRRWSRPSRPRPARRPRPPARSSRSAVRRPSSRSSCKPKP